MIESSELQKSAQPAGSVQPKNFHEHPIFLALLIWWFQYVPSRALYIAKKTIHKVYDFFSIALLLRTLTQPWKRDEIDSSNLALDEKIRVLMMNLVSVFIGFTVRSITIFLGLMAIFLLAVFCLTFIVIFYLLPVFSILMIYLGVVT